MDTKQITPIASVTGGKDNPTGTYPQAKPASSSRDTGTHFASSNREMPDGSSWLQHLIADLRGLRMSGASNRSLGC